jgi:CRP-like cAMP-binding protein
MIKKELLILYGAQKKTYSKAEIIFNVNDIARYFYQIEIREVKIFNQNKNGKEFIQSILSKNRIFGEVALLGDFNYPTSAITTCKTVVWRLAKNNFFSMLNHNQEIHLLISKNLAQSLHYKSMIANQISNQKAEQRIITLLQYLKQSVYKIDSSKQYKVEFSRQQIADLTGLRVETVIRAIKKLEQSNKIEIINHKLFF